MIRFIRNLFKNKSDEDRMYNYLSQATDQVHLELLQKEWDRKSYPERNQW